MDAIASGTILTGNLPFKTLCFLVSGKKVTGSPRTALEAAWGYRAAETLFDEKDLIWKSGFHLVWWAGMGAAMAQYLKMYRVWLTKHASEFCGNNVQMYNWSRGASSPKCDSCLVKDEYTSHICRHLPSCDSCYPTTPPLFLQLNTEQLQ